MGSRRNDRLSSAPVIACYSKTAVKYTFRAELDVPLMSPFEAYKEWPAGLNQQAVYHEQYICSSAVAAGLEANQTKLL